MSKKNLSQDAQDMIGELEKLFGKGTVMLATEKEPYGDVIPSTSFSFNYASGIGGVAKGKVYDIYADPSAGKSTLAYDLIGQCQKKYGDWALLLDKEDSYTATYGASLGIDNEKLIIINNKSEKIQSLENMYDILCAALESKKFGIIAVDSVTSFAPQSKLEDSAIMGVEARVNSDKMRKINNLMPKSNTALLLLRQSRVSIGGFGCFHGETLVNFVNGKSIPISEVVDKKIKGEVWSFNRELKQFEAVEIINWQNNGKVNAKEDYINFLVKATDGHSRYYGFAVTHDHEILTEEGWKKAKDIKLTDKLISREENKIHDEVLDMLSIMSCCDSTIDISKNKYGCRFILRNKRNPVYNNWKAEKLKDVFTFTRGSKLDYKLSSSGGFSLRKIKELIGTEKDITKIIQKFTNLQLAILIMDDGHFDYSSSHYRYRISFKRFKNNEIILNKIKSIFINSGITCSFNLKNGCFNFSKDESLKIAEKISKYVPECMQYKLPKEYQNKYEEFELKYNTTYNEIYCPIEKINFISSRKFKDRNKYDIEVSKNSNFVVGGIYNGIVAHNSPITVSGGTAIPFYSHVRIWVTRSEIDKELGKNKIKFNFVKNKMAVPFKLGVTLYDWTNGFDVASEMGDIALECGIITISGKTYTLPGIDKPIVGKKATIQYLQDNPQYVKEQIEPLVKAYLETNSEVVSEPDVQ